MWWNAQQLSAIDEVIGAARAARPAVLVVTGEPGAGKSSLLGELIDRANKYEVRLIQGVRSERDQRFAGLRQLIPIDAGSFLNAFQAAQLLRESIEPDGGSPVLIAVDDAQWVDPESMEALAWLVRRATRDRLLVAATTRPVPPARSTVRSLADLPMARALTLLGLDIHQTSQLARSLDPNVSDALAARLHAHTGGNPLYIRGILTEHGTTELEDLENLPAPSDLAEALTHRVRELSPTAATLLAAIAVLGDGWIALLQAGELAEIVDPGRDAQILADAGMVQLRRTSTGEEARIYHSVIRAAIHDGIPSEERRRLHVRASALITDRGEAIVHRMLAAAEYDDAIAEELAEFAWHLHLDHRNREAARFLRRAGRASRDPALREQRWLDALFDLVLARDVDPVEAELSEVSWAQDGVRRALVQGFVLIVRKQWLQASDLFDGISDGELAAADPVTRYRVLTLQGWCRLVTGSTDDRVLASLEQARNLAADPGFTGYLTFALAMARRTAAAEDPEAPASSRQRLYASAWHGMANALTGDADVAVRDLEALTTRIDSGQIDMGDGVFHALLGLSHWLRGDWRRAATLFDVAQGAPFGGTHPMVQALLPLTALISGNRARARKLMDESRAALRAAPWPQAIAAATVVETFILALAGEEDERRRYRSTVFADFGATDFPGAVPALWILSTGISAGWARDVSALEAAALRLEVAPQEWAVSGTLWLRGLAAGYRGDAAGAESLLRDAHDTWSPSLRIHRALLAADLAVSLSIQSPTEAAEYRAEHDSLLLHAGGVALLPDEIDPLEPLTEREKDVVTLMAEGLSYVQIAKELYLSRSTVAFHLSNAYAKTGTNSRHELVQLMRNPRANTGRNG